MNLLFFLCLSPSLRISHAYYIAPYLLYNGKPTQAASEAKGHFDDEIEINDFTQQVCCPIARILYPSFSLAVFHSWTTHSFFHSHRRDIALPAASVWKRLQPTVELPSPFEAHSLHQTKSQLVLAFIYIYIYITLHLG